MAKVYNASTDEWFLGWAKSRADELVKGGEALAEETIASFPAMAEAARRTEPVEVHLLSRFLDGFRAPNDDELRAHVAWPILWAWAADHNLSPRQELYDAVDPETHEPVHGALFRVLVVDVVG